MTKQQIISKLNILTASYECEVIIHGRSAMEYLRTEILALCDKLDEMEG